MRFVFSAIRFGLLFALVFAGSSRAEDAFVVEPGFKSLFNGSDLTGWRLDKDTLDGKTATIDHRYVVKDGVLVITGASPGQPPMNAIDTAAEFNQDFVLRLEFRASRDANSGIHLRDRDFKHQLQIRDYPRVGPYKMLTHYKARRLECDRGDVEKRLRWQGGDRPLYVQRRGFGEEPGAACPWHDRPPI